MPKREIGLMGYVGEAVLLQWLRLNYGAPQYEIVPQVMPVGVPRRGGPYLDFGVAENASMVAVFEVKSQDFIWEGRPNISLSYLWTRRGQVLTFQSQDGRTFSSTSSLRSILVLLSPPNEKGIKNLGATNLCDVLLFDEILADLGKHLDDQEIVAAIKEDVTKVLSILRSPTQGRRLKHSFLRVRGSSTSVLSCPPVDSHGS